MQLLPSSLAPLSSHALPQQRGNLRGLRFVAAFAHESCKPLGDGLKGAAQLIFSRIGQLLDRQLQPPGQDSKLSFHGTTRTAEFAGGMARTQEQIFLRFLLRLLQAVTAHQQSLEEQRWG